MNKNDLITKITAMATVVTSPGSALNLAKEIVAMLEAEGVMGAPAPQVEAAPVVVEKPKASKKAKVSSEENG